MSTWTAVLDTHLDLLAAVCAVLIVGALLHRMLRILVGMLFRAIPILAPPASINPKGLARFAQMGILGQALQFGLTFLVLGARVLAAAFQTFVWVVYAMLPLVMLSLLLVLIHERWSDTMLLLTSALNNGSFAPALRWALMAPLTLLDWAGTYVLPVWNLGVLIFFQMPIRLLAWMLSSSGAAELVVAVRELSAIPAALVQPVRTFVAANSRVACPLLVCVNASCVSLTPAVAAQACLQPTVRMLDTLPAAAHAQQASAHALVSLGTSCRSITLVLNVSLFPLTDPSLWYALDRGLNALLSAVVVAPTSTLMRCTMAGGFDVRPAMCTPDFRPAWDLAAESALAFGDTLTHWLSTAYQWIFEGQSAMDALCDSGSIFSGLLWPAASALFRQNASTLVRLSTNTDFALTDGVHVLWGSDLPRLRWTTALWAWPIPIDARFGIASVSVGTGAYGLLGCGCEDVQWKGDQTQVHIQCAVVSGASNHSAWVLPVVFSLGTEAQLLTCDRLRINVQSVRWPRMRVASQLGASSTPASVAADAAIYVTPICGAQDGIKAMACLPERSFVRGICFPYCLALRFRGEAFRPITMRGAAEWTDGVLLSNTDCSSLTTNPISSSSATGSNGDVVCRVSADVASASIPNGAMALGSSLATCGYAMGCTSAIADRTLHPGYSSRTVLPSAAENAGARLLLRSQPMVMGGGVQMRAFASTEGGDVDRVDFPTLVGNQANEFTVEPASPMGIPLNPNPPPTPSMQTTAYTTRPEVDMPPTYILPSHRVPYNPGTVTRDALWYATNPSYDSLSALIDYCWTQGKRTQTQIALVSNYAPLRLQRILFASDSCFMDTAGVTTCRDDTFAAAGLERTLPAISADAVLSSNVLYDLCASADPFNLYVEGLEFWDDANIAVAVRRGTMADLGAMLDGGAGGRTVYYFVQSSNLSQAREGVPWPNSPIATDMSAYIPSVVACPGLTTLPDVGGMFGHSMAALMHSMGTLTNLFFNPFAVIELLDARSYGTCPEDALQHSALAQCGMALLSLDHAFEEAYAAGHSTWDVVLWLVDIIFPADGPSLDVLGRPLTAAVLRDFLQGATVVGDASRVITLFDVQNWLSTFDVGAERYLDGAMRRRRLLQTENDKDAQKSPSILGHIHGGLKKGLSGFAALTRFVGSVLSGQLFAGADLGALLSTQSAHSHLVSTTVSAPAIAFAEFTYKAMLPMTLDAVAAIRKSKTNQSFVSSVASVWITLSTVRDLFDEIVDARLRQACSGVRLMVGYNTQLGQALYWNCRAGADTAPAMLQLLTTLFADLPLYRCLCVYPAGEDYLSYVQSTCPSFIPPSRKAFWQVRPYKIHARMLG